MAMLRTPRFGKARCGVALPAGVDGSAGVIALGRTPARRAHLQRDAGELELGGQARELVVRGSLSPGTREATPRIRRVVWVVPPERWRAYPDVDDELVFYCPECAELELGSSRFENRSPVRGCEQGLVGEPSFRTVGSFRSAATFRRESAGNPRAMAARRA